jgi:hypothetical protein
MAIRARDYVVDQRDMKTITRRLEQSYRAAVGVKRARLRT